MEMCCRTWHAVGQRTLVKRILRWVGPDDEDTAQGKRRAANELELRNSMSAATGERTRDASAEVL